MARELINRIQNIRKGKDFEITDKVKVTLSSEPEVREAVDAFGDYIAAQVLADEILLSDTVDAGKAEKLDIDGLEVMAIVEISGK